MIWTASNIFVAIRYKYLITEQWALSSGAAQKRHWPLLMMAMKVLIIIITLLAVTGKYSYVASYNIDCKIS